VESYGNLLPKEKEYETSLGWKSPGKTGPQKLPLLRNDETRKSDTDPSRKERDVADMPRTYRDALVGGE